MDSGICGLEGLTKGRRLGYNFRILKNKYLKRWGNTNIK